MRWPGFCGPSSTSRSLNVNAERTINLYPEIADSGTPKVKTWLVGTPGLKGFVNFTVRQGGPVRALWSMNGRAFAVIGNGFYEFFPWGRGKRWGMMAQSDGNPATISSNGTAGNQIFITSGGHGYIFRTDTNVFAEITDPNFPFPCSHGAFVDGYFVGLLAHTREFRCSALEDGTDWSGLDVAQVSLAGDNLRALAVNHREIWLFGEHTTHPWYNAGSSSQYYQGESFPFVPISGVVIEHGILAPHSVVQLDNTLFWLGADKLGAGTVWRAEGYIPKRISTHAVEYWLGTSNRLDRAIAYAYQDEGHAFYVLYVPDLETTWVYDTTTKAWHERAIWNEDTYRWEPHEGRCHCFAFGKHLIGSRTTGQIYEQSLDLYDEDVTLLESIVNTASASASPSASPGEIVAPVLGRACWFGYFYSLSDRYGYNPDAPQNFVYVEDANSVTTAIANAIPMMITADMIPNVAGSEGLVLGIYVSGGTPEDLALAANAARNLMPVGLTGKPIIGCCDGFLPTGAIADVDWLAPECYTLATETAAQCQARVEASLALLGPASVALIGLSYTSNTNNTQDATQLELSQVVPANIALSDSRVQMIIMFSDGRPTGTQSHEEWRYIHQDILDGITGPPAILP